VVVTADISEGVKELCRGAGADDFLEKPVYMDKLFGIVTAARGRIKRSGVA
jgi:DNA-binding response OmpR family regulator